MKPRNFDLLVGGAYHPRKNGEGWACPNKYCGATFGLARELGRHYKNPKNPRRAQCLEALRQKQLARARHDRDRARKLPRYEPATRRKHPVKPPVVVLDGLPTRPVGSNGRAGTDTPPLVAIYCVRCGSPMARGWEFCAGCGQKAAHTAVREMRRLARREGL